MAQESPIREACRRSARRRSASFAAPTRSKVGVTRNQLTALCARGVIDARAARHLSDDGGSRRPSEQRLRAALLWAGADAAAAGRSAGEVYGLEGVRAHMPEIVVRRYESAAPRRRHRAPRTAIEQALMVRRHRGIPVTGVGADARGAGGCARRRGVRDRVRGRAPAAAHLGSGTRTRISIGSAEPVGRESARFAAAARRARSDAPVAVDARGQDPAAARRRTASPTSCASSRSSGTVAPTSSTSRSTAAARSSRPTVAAGTTTRPTTNTTTRSGACPAATAIGIVFATWAKVTKQPQLLLGELAATLAA